MISMLAQKRICQEFVTYKDHAFAKGLYSNVISNICIKQNRHSNIDLDGTFLKPF